MDSNMNARLRPLIDQYNALTQDRDTDELTADNVAAALRATGAYSIPVLELVLKVAKQEANEIMVTDIPAMLAEYGLSKATLEDGTEVTKDTFWEVSQTGRDKAALASWLTSHGYESAIKDTFEFEKGSNLAELVAFINSEGLSYDRKSEVHSQTLKKILKDHYEKSGELPPEGAVKVSIFDRGVVKAPKNRKDF